LTEARYRIKDNNEPMNIKNTKQAIKHMLKYSFVDKSISACFKLISRNLNIELIFSATPKNTAEFFLKDFGGNNE